MKVAIVHPWFPQYRKPFFDRVLRLAAVQDIVIDVFYGDPPPEWGERGDSVDAEYATKLPTRFVKIGSRNLVLKSPRPIWSRGPYDVVVLEQAVRNLESYALMVRRHGADLAFWGHGRTYTSKTGKLQEGLKEQMTKRADWFFAYTAGGADAVAATGFPRDRITVVQNSIDSTSLQNSVTSVSEETKIAFERKHDLRGRTGLFIGGLDSSKRLDFLIAAASKAYEADNDFRLIVAGSGSDRVAVEEASDIHSWLSYIGPVFGSEKAVAMKAAQVLLMPGRVGLVAVDSFAAGVPILTTDWSFHAPEFEYLRPGYNSLVTPDNVDAYAEAIVSCLNDPTALSRIIEGASSSSTEYSIDRMAANFMSGLQSLRAKRAG